MPNMAFVTWEVEDVGEETNVAERKAREKISRGDITLAPEPTPVSVEVGEAKFILFWIPQGEIDAAEGEQRGGMCCRCHTAPLGGRVHLLLAFSEQEDELRDYERLCATAEAFVYVTMARLMVRRLARA